MRDRDRVAQRRTDKFGNQFVAELCQMRGTVWCVKTGRNFGQAWVYTGIVKKESDQDEETGARMVEAACLICGDALQAYVLLLLRVNLKGADFASGLWRVKVLGGSFEYVSIS